MANKKISFDLNEAEAKEFNALVEASGLSKTDFIKKCCLPSKGCSVIFLNGADILVKLSELYEVARKGSIENMELYKFTDDLFAAFDELVDKIGGDNNNGSI